MMLLSPILQIHYHMELTSIKLKLLQLAYSGLKKDFINTITVNVLPDIDPGLISIVENNDEGIQICDDEQVNLDISTYPSGA